MTLSSQERIAGGHTRILIMFAFVEPGRVPIGLASRGKPAQVGACAQVHGTTDPCQRHTPHQKVRGVQLAGMRCMKTGLTASFLRWGFSGTSIH